MKKKIVFSIIAVSFWVLVSQVNAQVGFDSNPPQLPNIDGTSQFQTEEPEDRPSVIDNIQQDIILPSEGQENDGERAPIVIENYLGGDRGAIYTDVTDFILTRFGDALNIMFGLIGVLAIIPIIWGSFQLITSQGQTKRVTAGKDALFWGVVGMVIAFAGIVIFNFILRTVIQ